MTSEKEPQMQEKPKIELKPLPSENEDTKRILDNTRKSIENLNLYVEDFFETMAILRENFEKLKTKSDAEKEQELMQSIAQVESRIQEVTSSMKEISKVMSDFVDLKHETGEA